MGSFFCLHYQFNLFFRFSLLRRVLYRDARRSERIVEQGERIRSWASGGPWESKGGNQPLYGKEAALFKTGEVVFE